MGQTMYHIWDLQNYNEICVSFTLVTLIFIPGFFWIGVNFSRVEFGYLRKLYFIEWERVFGPAPMAYSQPPMRLLWL